MAKLVRYDSEARAAIKAGVDKLANAVRVTLGPKGRNVILNRDYSGPYVTKDGVTIAREISLKDQFEDVGAQMIKNAASTTCDDAGDGTTTAAVLGQAIFNEGYKLMLAGHNPMELKRGIDKAVHAVIGQLTSLSKETNKREEIAQVGTISANGDGTIGELLAEAMEKVGREGVITIEEAKGFETSLDVVEGMQFDRGYISPYFINKPEKSTTELQGSYVLINEGRLDSMEDMLDILDKVAKEGKPLLIIAEDVGGNLLPGLIVNKMRGVINVCAVKAPGFGDRRKALLKDIAVLTGGTLFGDDADIKVSTATPALLGTVDKALVTRTHTTLIGGGGLPAEIEGRINQIKQDLEEATNNWDREKTQERLAKLLGGIAVIKVGAPTEPEMKEKKDRVEDAMHATRAAVQEGVVPGGGTALLRCADQVRDVISGLSGGEEAGAQIVLRALEAPLRQIVSNAGESAYMVAKQVTSLSGNHGYNAATGECCDLLKAGIIDPTKVVRCALQNAASVAGLLLTTEAVVADDPDEEKPQPLQG